MKSSNVINSFKKWITVSAFIPFIISIFCTGDDPVTGTVTETDTGITAKIYNPDGITPASGAIVKIFEANDTSRNAIKQVLTDAKGQYSIKGISAGRYSMYAEKGNLVAYQDSIVALDDTVLLKDDTLETAKRVTAIVGMQPNHNPQGVTVQIIGSEFYANVDDNAGHFTFDKLANGTYRLKLETYYEGYTTTYKTITISPTTPDTLLDTLWMIYTGIPVVRDISAQYDTLNGQVILSWKSTDYKDFQEYLIYRDNVNALTLSTVPIAVTTDTIYIDSIYRMNLQTGEYSSSDTTTHAYKYRIAIRNSSQFTGTAYKQTNVTAVPPSLVKSTFSYITKHIPLNIVSGKASVNDSILYNVFISNPTRNLKKIIWRDFYKNQIIKETITDTTKKTSSDGVVYLWDSIGIRQLECSVIDAAGTVWNDTVSFTIVPDFPTVIASSITPVVGINDTIRMQSTVLDTFGFITKWEWSRGDTSNWVEGSIDAVIIAPPKENLSYPVFVRVTDDDGNKSIAAIAIKVEARAPIANAGSDTAVGINDLIQLSAMGSVDETQITEYAWKCGNTNWISDSDGDVSVKAPSTAQAFICSLQVKDNEGNYGYDVKLVTVETRAPIAYAGNDTIAIVNDTIKLHGIGTDESSVIKYEWKFGKTNWIVTESGDAATIAPATMQAFPCSLRVTDDDGNITYSEVTINIATLVEDIDGNTYPAVKIGNQIWTTVNLRTTRYNDGTPINFVTENIQWEYAPTGAYCFYNNSTDSLERENWGALYNWYAVTTNKLAPIGWHVPTNREWVLLDNYLIANGFNFDGTTTGFKNSKALASTIEWSFAVENGSVGNNKNLNNASGFSALPGGLRDIYGNFSSQLNSGLWWTPDYLFNSSQNILPLNRHLNFNTTTLHYSNNDPRYGFSVRLIKDD